MPVAVVCVEGVLKKPSGQVSDLGHRLYRGLAEAYRVILVTGETDRARTADWLAVEGFARHEHVIQGDAAAPASWWPHAVRTLQISWGVDAEITVVPDPAAATELIRAGLNAVLVTPAAYSLPEWRPDHPGGVTPWADLEAEARTQRRLRAADERFTQGELF